MPGNYDIDKIFPEKGNSFPVPDVRPGWTRERNEPHPVDPSAAPGAAPRFDNTRPEK